MQTKTRIELTIDPDVKEWANEHVSNMSDMFNRYLKTQMSMNQSKESLEVQKKELEKIMMDLESKIKMLEFQDNLELEKVKEEQAKEKQAEESENIKFDKWILDFIPLQELKIFNEDDDTQYHELYRKIKEKFNVKPIGLYEQIKRMKAELS
jgi:hypothetical protein